MPIIIHIHVIINAKDGPWLVVRKAQNTKIVHDNGLSPVSGVLMENRRRQTRYLKPSTNLPAESTTYDGYSDDNPSSEDDIADNEQENNEQVP